MAVQTAEGPEAADLALLRLTFWQFTPPAKQVVPLLETKVCAFSGPDSYNHVTIWKFCITQGWAL